MSRGLHRTLVTALALAALAAPPAFAQTSTGGAAVEPQAGKTLDETNAKPGTQGGEEPGADTTGSVTQPQPSQTGQEPLNQDQQSPGTTLQQQKGKTGTQSGSEPSQQ
jgi:hypothetical protein